MIGPPAGAVGTLGAAGAPGVTDVGSVVVEVPDCFVEAGAGCLSRIVLPTPACRVARIDRDSDVIMNKIASWIRSG